MKPKDKAVAAVHGGKLVECTPEEWTDVRTALQEVSGKYIDEGDPIRAQICLQEVKRLDSKFDMKEEPV